MRCIGSSKFLHSLLRSGLIKSSCVGQHSWRYRKRCFLVCSPVQSGKTPYCRLCSFSNFKIELSRHAHIRTYIHTHVIDLIVTRWVFLYCLGKKTWNVELNFLRCCFFAESEAGGVHTNMQTAVSLIFWRNCLVPLLQNPFSPSPCHVAPSLFPPFFRWFCSHYFPFPNALFTQQPRINKRFPCLSILRWVDWIFATYLLNTVWFWLFPVLWIQAQ